MKVKFQSAVIFVKDIENSKAFYSGVLSQEIGLDLGANVNFKCGIALWQNSRVNEIIFNKPNAVIRDTTNKNMELYFESDNIEKTAGELELHSVRFIHKLKEEPWLQLTMRFYDPDGNIVEVGESMSALVRRLYRDNLSIKEISEKTTLPVDYVQSLLL
jgi:predicted enzyme related to lactoylglutathione lyase